MMPELMSKQEAVSLGLSRYFTGKKCLRGHVSERTTTSGNCIACQLEHSKSDKGAATIARLKASPEYKEKAKANSARYHAENRAACVEKMKGRNLAYYAKHRERIIGQATEYQRNNPEQRNAYKVQWTAKRKKSDPEFASLLIMRKLVSRMCERVKIGRRQIGRTIEALGYDAGQFRAHIEAQFRDGMDWVNHGSWHVDHIQPLASFDLTDPAQRKQANALANLQPLWAAENMAKGAKLG